MQCRAHVSQLAKLYDRIQQAGAEVIVILGDTPEKSKSYVELLKLPFPVLSDPQRLVYQAYELGKFLLIQRTASVVVDRQGRMQYLKQAINPMTWLQESRELIEFVESMNNRY